jgi:hypothetical protein
MEPFLDAIDFLAGTPALVGPILAALVIFLTSDWRLALGALFAQYVLVGLALTQYLRPEVAVVKVLVGIVVVLMLYLTARRLQEMLRALDDGDNPPWFPSFRVGWRGGALGLPLRLLCVLLVVLALVRLFQDYESTVVPIEIALVACWLGGMGMIGLVLGGDPLRVALAFLTILTGFDLVYAALEPILAIAGFFAAFTLSAALAFSYLAIMNGLHISEAAPEDVEQ